MAKILTIGALSKQSGVKVTTIRYYESIGLMEAPPRSDSGQRQYDDHALQRLNFIRHARDLGFTVDAIRELINLQTHTSEDCAAVDAVARHHLTNVQQRLTQLTALETELKRMITSCAGGKIDECRVLATLGDHANCLVDAHQKLPV